MLLFLIASDFIKSIGSVGTCELPLQKLQPAYEQVIDSIIDKSVVPYYPNIYPIPFMIIKRHRVRFYVTHVLLSYIRLFEVTIIVI